MASKGQILILRQFIEAAEGCAVRWLRTVPVVEMHQGDIVWEGEVEVFELTDHPETHRGYGWPFVDVDGKTRFRFVLHKPPVNSPEDAVRAAIAAEYRANE